MSLKEEAVKGTYWSAIEKLGQLVVQIIVSVVLARLLSPDDYGMIGMLSVFLLFSNIFIDSGFSEGLMRKQDCNRDDYTSVFWFNLFVSIVVYWLLYFLAPFITVYFNMPGLTVVSRVFFLSIPLNALNLIQVTILNKKLDFKKIAKYTIFSSVISGIVGITMAYKGCEVWALVVRVLLNTVIYSFFLWKHSVWHPVFSFSIAPLKSIWGFSSNLLATKILNTLFNNVYTFIIAKVYSSKELGFYSQANKYATIPSSLTEGILGRVAFPVLAKLQNNIGSLRENYKKLFLCIVFVLLPAMVLMNILADDLVLLLLTDKWASSIPYFKVICVMGITYPLQTLSITVLKVRGLSGMILKLEFVKKILIVLIILATFRYGILIMLYGQLLFYVSALLLNMYFSGRSIQLPMREQLLNIIRIFISVVAAYWVVFYIRTDSQIQNIVIKSALFIFSYLSVLFLMDRRMLYMWKEIRATLK